MLFLKQMAPHWLKKPALRLMSKYRRAIWPYRRATCSSRSLPDFIIIGAMKSGTSSLYLYLGQHPQLLPSFKKEIHFSRCRILNDFSRERVFGLCYLESCCVYSAPFYQDSAFYYLFNVQPSQLVLSGLYRFLFWKLYPKTTDSIGL